MPRVVNKYKSQEEIFRGRGGILKTSQALDMGIHPRDLYAMRARGIIEPLSRGLYRLAARPRSRRHRG